MLNTRRYLSVTGLEWFKFHFLVGVHNYKQIG